MGLAHRASRFLPCKLATKRMTDEHLSEKLLDVEIMMSEAELQAEAEAEVARNNAIMEKWNAEDDAGEGSDYDGVDWGQSSRIYRDLSDEADEQTSQEVFDERDDFDFEIALSEFFEAAFEASKTDPEAKSMLKGMIEDHISPEAREICNLPE